MSALGIGTRQLRTGAPDAVNLDGVSAAEGVSELAARADHAHPLTGELPVEHGGTGASTAADARTALGLGGAAVLSVGTTAGTVAAGDDSRIVGAAQKSANLSDLASASTARTNLSLGTSALLNAPASGDAASGEVVKGSDTRLTDFRTANALRETLGPTTLPIGSVADGEFLRRVGSALVGAASAGDFASPSFPGGVLMSAAVGGRTHTPASLGVDAQSAGSAVALDTLYAMRCVVPACMVGIPIRVEVRAGATNAAARLKLAVYASTSSTNPYPGARVELSAEIAGVTNGTYHASSFEWTPSAAGIYWLAVVAGASAPTLTIHTPGRYGFLEGYTTTVGQGGYSVAFAYADPPSTYPAGATTSSQPPMLYTTRD